MKVIICGVQSVNFADEKRNIQGFKLHMLVPSVNVKGWSTDSRFVAVTSPVYPKIAGVANSGQIVGVVANVEADFKGRLVDIDLTDDVVNFD